ncbi:hypothetical protein CJ030_MR1G004101 [Morella rubra]|uniref:RNase H type-1 domain-containing protein n=1 Tax=Morella rubra TaxID=262757 RepID=A0A6A1UK81_9ROSI|nr:hypothetical protein CJ030_MR0G006608 [Morella rubra]KAB1225889.1 hypothetical protein CJ030_MR1G004101 [Morella rubra]
MADTTALCPHLIPSGGPVEKLTSLDPLVQCREEKQLVLEVAGSLQDDGLVGSSAPLGRIACLGTPNSLPDLRKLGDVPSHSEKPCADPQVDWAQSVDYPPNHSVRFQELNDLSLNPKSSLLPMRKPTIHRHSGSLGQQENSSSTKLLSSKRDWDSDDMPLIVLKKRHTELSPAHGKTADRSKIYVKKRKVKAQGPAKSNLIRRLVSARGSWRKGSNPLKGEALAALLACQLAVDLNCSQVIPWLYAHRSMSGVTPDWLIDGEIHRIRCILDEHPMWKFLWTPRDGNCTAHFVARWCNNSQTLWFYSSLSSADRYSCM